MMTVIGEARIEERVMEEHFACDLKKCRGACCTLPGRRGAPLQDDEVGEIERILPSVVKYLPVFHRTVIASSGWIEGSAGDYTTACIGGEDCVFVFYEGDVAQCAFERGYLDGETNWRKPISCHLFPVRVSKMSGDVILRYEELEQCRPALERGRTEGIPLYEFIRESLIRRYDGSWYTSFVTACQARNRSDMTR